MVENPTKLVDRPYRFKTDLTEHMRVTKDFQKDNLHNAFTRKKLRL